MINRLKLNNFKEALNYIYSFIPQENATLYPGDFGLKRMKYFMTLLGNPQDTYKSIHIAGTSGKGSTAYLTSLLLISHGFKVGLILKPHILDIRERYQINNNLITEKEFCQYITNLIPVIEKIKNSEYGIPTYAEINTALAFVIFADRKVDYAVIETYLGGTYDCTNVINRIDKLVLLTKIGFDHTKILGNSLTQIAAQKAGIINNGNQVFAVDQRKQVMNVFKKAAADSKSNIQIITKNVNFNNIILSLKSVKFDFNLEIVKSNLKFVIKNLKLSLPGDFQTENASLAITALLYLASRDKFVADEENIRYSYAHAYFKGRMEIIRHNNKRIIIDGAHNVQKMKALLTSLSNIYPDKKFNFLVAFMLGKDVKSMLKIIVKYAYSITASTFFIDNQDWIRKAEKPEKIENYLKSLGFSNYIYKTDINEAFNHAIEKTDEILVITGSQYFISEVYKKINVLQEN